jgi:ribosomal protein L1
MSAYRVEWECCGSESLTEAWEPEGCPFCTEHKLRAEIERLRAALERICDCDWVITLPDRMDAVRDLARQALKEV